MNKRRVVSRIMANDAAALRELAADHALDFLVVVAAVRAGGDEDRDVLKPDAGHLRDQRFQHHLARLGSSDVANGNADLAAGLVEIPQRGLSYRRLDRLDESVFRIR